MLKVFGVFFILILVATLFIPDGDILLDYASSLQEACVTNHKCSHIQPPPQNILRVMGLKVSKDEFTFFVPFGFDAKFASGGVNKDLTIGMDDDPNPPIYKCSNVNNHWQCDIQLK